MSGTVYRVPGLKTVQVRAVARQVREQLGMATVPYFPVMDVLEKVLDSRLDLIRFEVWDDAELQGAEGLSFKDSDGVDRIALPLTVYHAACGGDGRARFTASHELGHWVLHSQVMLQRVRQENLRGLYESSEWQANTFAAEILMPIEFLSRNDTAEDLCKRFGVSTQAAETRLRALINQGAI